MKNSPSALSFLLAICLLYASVSAQRLAVLTPEKEARVYAEKLNESLSAKFKILDHSLAETAWLSVNPETPFNLTASESRLIGEAIGCDYFLLVRSATLRRSSFTTAEYYESFAVVFLVNTRTGRLVLWDLESREAATSADSQERLLNSTAGQAAEIVNAIGLDRKRPPEKTNAGISEMPSEGSPESLGLRPTMPYKRFKPEYTRTAYLYDVKATVEAEVTIDSEGTILKAEIVRWAGFGLDEAVIDAVNKMNWRPAERNGKPLPMRVLLRYNFTKIERD